MRIMLETFDVTAEAVKECMHHGDPLMFVELRHHHQHDWSLFKVRGAFRFENDALEQPKTALKQHSCLRPRKRRHRASRDCAQA